MVSWYGPQGDQPTGGIFHYEQAQELNKYCNCAIYYPYDRYIDQPVTYGEEWGVKTYRSKYKLENKLRNRLNMYRAMKRIVKEFKPDIIHGNVATEAGRFAAILGLLFHIPVVISEHSSAEYSGVDCWPHHFYAWYSYGLSRYNTCVSDHLTERLSQIFPKYEFHTVYDGIKAPAPASAAVGENYKKEGYINISVVAGFYDQWIKGFHLILPALKRLKCDGEKVMLHVLGGGDWLEHYKNMATELGIDDIIIFYGNCSKQKVYDIVSQMDYSLSASHVESFGCSLAEAAMLGRPMVATRCGGPESIVDENSGILIAPDSEDELYDAMKRMNRMYTTYDQESISRRATEKFEIGRITKQYLDIYNEVLGI